MEKKFNKRKSNSRRKPQGKKFSREEGSVKDKETEFKSKKSSTNDIAWYSKNAEMLKNASDISYGNIMGYPIHVKRGEVQPSDLPDPVAAGIAIMDYVHGIGYTDNSHMDDPINVAARNIFSKVRKTNSGYSNYDPNDMMMYILAINEVYVFYSNIMRAYGVYNTYNVNSVYQPRKLVEALGFDYDDMITNLPGYRNLLNTIAARINVYAVPNDLSFITRQFWLCSGIYQDSASMKAQLYAFRPAIYRQFYDEGTSGLKLKAVKYPYTDSNTLLTLSDCKTIANDLLTAITGSEDCGIISGDIRKAYDSNVWALGSINPDYVILPATDYTVLAQIENATICGPVENEAILDITQNNDINIGAICYNPRFSSAAPFTQIETLDVDPRCRNRVINSHMDKYPDYAFTVEATRLMTALTNAYFGNDKTKMLLLPLAMGTEYVASVKVFYGTKTQQIGSTTAVEMPAENFASGMLVHTVSEPVTTASDNLKHIMTMLQSTYNFDWFPMLHMVDYITGDNGKELNVIQMLDLDNYTIVPSNTLNNIHYACLLSLFNIVE